MQWNYDHKQTDDQTVVILRILNNKTGYCNEQQAIKKVDSGEVSVSIFKASLEWVKKWHELSEMSLFIIFVSLLIITLYNFAFYRSNGTPLVIVQLVLIAVSIGYMMVYITIKLYKKLCALKMKNETPVSRECIDVSDSLPYRLLNNDDNEDWKND